MEEIQAFSQVRFLLSLSDQYVYMSNTKTNFIFAVVIDECKLLRMCGSLVHVMLDFSEPPKKSVENCCSPVRMCSYSRVNNM